jgi:tetratricopeptide (TPR) repeat protein
MARPLRAAQRRLARRLLSLTLGTLATFVGFELLLSGAYKVFAWNQARQNARALEGGDGEIRIVCIGESTTAVAGDETGKMLVPRTSYPTRLEEILNTRQDELRFRVLNNGIMGGTSGSALELLRLTIDTAHPDVVIAMMGIKDTPNEYVPVSAALPRWANSRATVPRARWLLEGMRLRANANVTDIRTWSDLPPSAQQKQVMLGNYLRELRMADDTVALDRARAAIYLLRIGRLRQAEDIMREVTTERDVGYGLLAEIQVTAGEHEAALETLRAARVRHPEEGMYLVSQADILLHQEKYEAADALLVEGLDGIAALREPELTRPYLQLERAEILLAQERWDEALAMLASINAVSHPRYHDVVQPVRLPQLSAQGRAYIGKQDWPRAEAALKEALEISPGRHSNMWLLSQVYRQTGQTEKEEAVRWELLEWEGRVAEYFELAKLFRLSGQPERVPEVLQMAVEHTPSLRENYAALYTLARQEGFKLVIMQYPSFDLASLHLYAPKAPGVTFIDNQHVFDADPEGYFFEPTYPNSFSHYTDKGARVLAEHVADTVLGLYAAGGTTPAE